MCYAIQLSLIFFSFQIARINGSSQTDDSVVILGAHQDRQVVCLRNIIRLIIVLTVRVSGLSSQRQVSGS